MVRNPETEATISSIPTATTPALNSKAVIGIKVDATDNPGELRQVRIKNDVVATSVEKRKEQTVANEVDSADLKAKTEKALGRSLTSQEFVAIQKAHDVGQGHFLGRQNSNGTFEKNENPDLAYTPQEIAEKARILKEAGFNEEERRKLIEYAIAGISEIREDELAQARLKLQQFQNINSHVNHVIESSFLKWLRNLNIDNIFIYTSLTKEIGNMKLCYVTYIDEYARENTDYPPDSPFRYEPVSGLKDRYMVVDLDEAGEIKAIWIQILRSGGSDAEMMNISLTYVYHYSNLSMKI